MTRRTLFNIILYIILIAFAIFYLLPIYLMLLTGFKPINQVDLKTMWASANNWAPLSRISLRASSSLRQI